MVHGQNGAHLSEFLLRNKLEGYTQGKGRAGLQSMHTDGSRLHASFRLSIFANEETSSRTDKKDYQNKHNYKKGDDHLDRHCEPLYRKSKSALMIEFYQGACRACLRLQSRHDLFSRTLLHQETAPISPPDRQAGRNNRT